VELFVVVLLSKTTYQQPHNSYLLVCYWN